MSKSIVGLIAENQSSTAISVVEKALAKKLLRAISEQASEVARQAYGTLDEYYGGDEQPDYVNNEDNTYAVFFANALKKFGVNGPEDFKDDVTKQRFFDYVDHNWRSQDSVQAPIQGANGGNMENGTQTQLPAPAAPPQAPIAPTQGLTPTTAQGNDPSVATMAAAGPSIDKTAPMGAQGSDPTLNGVQNQQTFAGQGSIGGVAPAAGAGAMAGTPQTPQQSSCPYCKGSGLASCPTCGRAHGLDNQQGGMGGDGGVDPDLDNDDDEIQSRLHIGPEGEDADNSAETGEEAGLEGGEQDPNGENIDGSMGDGMGAEEDGMGGDEAGLEGGEMGDEMGGDEMGAGQQQAPGAPGEEEDVDDPFDDEDAYTIDSSDFGGAGGEEGDEEVDEDGNPIESGDEEVDEDGNPIESGDEEVDEDGNPIESDDEDLGDDEGGGFGSGDEEGEDQDDEEDPDLEIGDEDTGDEEEDDEEPKKKVVPVGEALKHRSWSRKERKADSKKPVRAAGKKEARLAEDFGFGLDDAEDNVFLAEAGLMMQAKPEPVDPGLNKIIGYVQQQLSKIKKLRNTMLMQLRRQRAVIKKDPALGPEEKMEALKQLATMAKDNRRFFKTQAKTVKAMFTGKLGGEDVEAPEGEEGMEGGMDQDQEGMDQGQGQAPQQGGFPPAGDDEEGGVEDEGGEELEGGDEDMGADEGDEGGEEEQGGFPPKKKSPFPPKKKEGGFPPKKKAAFPPAKDKGKSNKVTEEELKEYQSKAAIEGKIRMLTMQIKSQGDSGGKRRAALKQLQSQLARS